MKDSIFTDKTRVDSNSKKRRTLASQDQTYRKLTTAELYFRPRRKAIQTNVCQSERTSITNQ